MDSFEPSKNFVTRVMNDVQRYESAIKNERVNALLSSKAALSVLWVGGVLFGIFNLFRMASYLLLPSLCL
jgi:hypothetical protein